MVEKCPAETLQVPKRPTFLFSIKKIHFIEQTYSFILLRIVHIKFVNKIMHAFYFQLLSLWLHANHYVRDLWAKGQMIIRWHQEPYMGVMPHWTLGQNVLLFTFCTADHGMVLQRNKPTFKGHSTQAVTQKNNLRCCLWHSNCLQDITTPCQLPNCEWSNRIRITKSKVATTSRCCHLQWKQIERQIKWLISTVLAIQRCLKTVNVLWFYGNNDKL